MLFLVDAQLPPALARWLAAKGHQALHVADRQMETEIVRENSLSKEHMDGWRQFISRLPPTDYR